MRLRRCLYRLSLSAAACALALPLSAQAQTQGVYAKAGFLGFGLGYAHSVSDALSVRADATTVGTFSRNGTAGSVAYNAKLKANQLGVYGDWFPFQNGFRLSAGLHLRKLEVTANGRPTAAGTVTVNNTVVNYGAGDAITGRVKFPSVAPYIGLGWGHHGSQQAGLGLGFAFDLGVAFGRPKTSLGANANLRAKLDAAAAFLGTTGANEIEIERQALARKVNKLRAFPHLSVSVAYRF